jgi:hypothetical protein
LHRWYAIVISERAMKTCTKCGVEKPLDEFYRNVNGVGGLQW